MSGGRSCREPVKIVIINTQYVETDAGSFKSVVQKLTGNSQDCLSSTMDAKPRSADAAGSVASAEGFQASHCKNKALLRDLSFKEFDRMFRDLPPVDDLFGFLED